MVEDINSIMDLLDSDKNGFIDYSEFLKATVDWNRYLSRQNLEHVFNIFDK